MSKIISEETLQKLANLIAKEISDNQKSIKYLVASDLKVENIGNSINIKNGNGNVIDIYFGNENFEIIDDYKMLCTVTIEDDEITMGELINENIYPSDVYYLLACPHGTKTVIGASTLTYSKKEKTKDLGNKLYTVGLLSDVHISTETSDSTYSRDDLANALSYFKNTANADMVCITGDLTISGTRAEFQKFQEIVSPYESTMPIYACNGNHDTYTDSSYFESETTQIFDRKIVKGDDVYLFISVYQEGGSSCFRTTTMPWLIDKLESLSAKNRRVFLFTHFFVANIGNAGYCYYSGEHYTNSSGTDGMLFRTILAQFPNVILFTGHSHIIPSDQLRGFPETNISGEKYPFGKQVHIPSCAKPRKATEDFSSYSNLSSGSYGYVMDVHENGLLLNCIDFALDDSNDGYENKRDACGQFVIETAPKLTDAENGDVLLKVNDFSVYYKAYELRGLTTEKNRLILDGNGYVTYEYHLKNVDTTRHLYVKAGQFKRTNLTTGNDCSSTSYTGAILYCCNGANDNANPFYNYEYNNIIDEVDLGIPSSNEVYIRFSPKVSSHYSTTSQVQYDIRNLYFYQKGEKSLLRNIDFSKPTSLDSGITTTATSVTLPSANKEAIYDFKISGIKPNRHIVAKYDSLTDENGNTINPKTLSVGMQLFIYRNKDFTDYLCSTSSYHDYSGEGYIVEEVPRYYCSSKKLIDETELYVRIKVRSGSSSTATFPITLNFENFRLVQEIDMNYDESLAFKLDGTSGTIEDISGKNVAITNVGNCVSTIGEGITFGDGQYLSIPYSTLNTVGEYSIEMVVQLPTNSANNDVERILSFGTTSPNRVTLRITASGDGTHQIDIDGTTGMSSSGAYKLYDGQIVHLALIKASSSTLYLYVNGKRRVLGLDNIDLSGASNLYFGAKYDVSSFSNGYKLRYLRISNSYWDSATVQQLFIKYMKTLA